MHHGFIDKIWNDWQQLSIVNKYAHFLNINQQMQSSPYYPRDFIDIANQPKCVKVCYDDPRVNKAKQVKAYLKSKSLICLNLFIHGGQTASSAKCARKICLETISARVDALPELFG